MTATAKVRASGFDARDAIVLLKDDHKIIEQLFAIFDWARGRRERKNVSRQICKLLTVHMAIEEQAIYPRAHRVLPSDASIYEAEVEHTVAKVLIADIESFSVVDRRFDATMKVLAEYIRHHVKVEETEIFPELRRTDLDMKALGIELAVRRVKLLSLAGLDENALHIATKTKKVTEKTRRSRPQNDAASWH